MILNLTGLCVYAGLKALRPEKMPDGIVIGSKICWFAFCISIDVQMIYNPSVTRARDSVNNDAEAM